MPQWDYMCKDFLRGNNCERESRKRDGEGWGSFQAADLTLGAGRRQKWLECLRLLCDTRKAIEEACASRELVCFSSPQEKQPVWTL